MTRKLLAGIAIILYVQAAYAQPGNADTNYISGEKLGAKLWALVSQSVVNMRSEPTFKAEMISQALLGTPVKIWAITDGWTKIETPEGYTGWVSAPLQRIDSAQLHAFNKKPRVVVTDNENFIYAAPGKNADIVTEVIMGNIFYLDNNTPVNTFYKVSLPDGRKGYIPSSAVKKWNDWKNSIQLSGKSLEQVAKRFVGIPYFWGGTSSRGLDCSGLTKTTYLMHGIILPRDARQQYLTGVAVDSANNFSQLKKGDLLFFGKKHKDDTTRYNIVHTAIYLEDQKFIQAASGYVQVNSLKPGTPDYDAHNRNRYVIAKRIIGEPANGTWSIFAHPWYN